MDDEPNFDPSFLLCHPEPWTALSLGAGEAEPESENVLNPPRFDGLPGSEATGPYVNGMQGLGFQLPGQGPMSAPISQPAGHLATEPEPLDLAQLDHQPGSFQNFRATAPNLTAQQGAFENFKSLSEPDVLLSGPENLSYNYPVDLPPTAGSSLDFDIDSLHLLSMPGLLCQRISTTTPSSRAENLLNPHMFEMVLSHTVQVAPVSTTLTWKYPYGPLPPADMPRKRLLANDSAPPTRIHKRIKGKTISVVPPSSLTTFLVDGNQKARRKKTKSACLSCMLNRRKVSILKSRPWEEIYAKSPSAPRELLAGAVLVEQDFGRPFASGRILQN